MNAYHTVWIATLLAVVFNIAAALLAGTGTHAHDDHNFFAKFVTVLRANKTDLLQSSILLALYVSIATLLATLAVRRIRY